MAPLPYTWQNIKGLPYCQIAIPLQNARGEWLCAARWTDTGAIFAGSSAETADKARDQVAALLDFAIAARRITGPAFPEASTEPTPEGLQYVIPGCEKDRTRGPAQMSFF